MVVDKAHPEAGFIEFEPIAIGLVDLVAVVVASACLLLVMAGWVVGWLISELLGGIAIGPIHPFRSLGGDIQNVMLGIAQPLIRFMKPIGHAAWSIAMTVWRFVYVVTTVMGSMALRITGVSQQSQDGLAQLRAQEQSDIQIVDAFIENAQQEITDNAIFAQTYTDTRVDNIYNQLTREDIQRVAAETTRATGIEDGLRTQLNANVNTLNHLTQVTIPGIDTTINNDVRTINATITRDVTDLKAADATNLRTAENFATGLVSGLGIDALKQTVTALQGDVGKIKTETTECLDPLCDTVTPNASKLGNVGKYLKLLENLGVEAFFLALAIEAVNDPKTVADDMELVLEPLGDLSITVLRDTIGI